MTYLTKFLTIKLCTNNTWFLSSAQPTKIKLSPSGNITEGTYATITCIAPRNTFIWWRIGSFKYIHNGHTFLYNTPDELHKIQGLTADIVRTTSNSKRKKSVIKILATADLNGTPIECKSTINAQVEEYSQFVILTVTSNPSIT